MDEKGPFTSMIYDDLPTKIVIVLTSSHVELPEGDGDRVGI